MGKTSRGKKAKRTTPDDLLKTKDHPIELDEKELAV
jgi:hypothetical protein